MTVRLGALVTTWAALSASPPLRLAAQLPDATRRAVDSVFIAYDRTDAPGCALAVYQDGRISYARGYGMANLELGVAIAPSTVFDIGSTSKQFAAFAIALLEQDGKLSHEDPVRKHIPELGEWAGGVTIRHLVHHTSGLRDYLALMSLAGVRFDDVTDDQDALKLIVRQKAGNFAPGSEWLYSNSGYFLLSQIVKRVSGQTLRAFAEARIFGPLGMRRTHFHDDHTMVVANRAAGYVPGPGGYAIEMSNFEQTGDGAVYTTVEELLLWDRNWYDGAVGGPDLLRRQLETGKLTSGADHGYAGGLFVTSMRGLRVVRHGGAWAGYRAELLRFPDQRTSVACLCNRGDANPSGLADRVAVAILGDRMGPAPAAPGGGAPAGVSVAPEVLARHAGTWRSPGSGDLIVLEAQDGGLVPLGTRAPLRALAPDRFARGAATLIFESDALRVERDGRVEDRFQRVPAVPAGASPAAYAGSWYSEELDATWRLLPDSTGLRVEVRDRPMMRLRQVGPDLFSNGGRHLAFTRQGSRLTGFTVSAGRVRGIGFVQSR